MQRLVAVADATLAMCGAARTQSNKALEWLPERAMRTIPGPGGATVLSIRHSRLDDNSFIPTSYAQIKTDLRVELGMYGAAQTSSNFIDIDAFPSTINHPGPSCLVFVRTPELRIAPYDKDGLGMAFSPEAPSSALDTGRINRIDPAVGTRITRWHQAMDAVTSLRLDRAYLGDRGC
ncbi:hypothetical protein QTI17_29825 [Variovorax sp. J31P179]|uniref:hypothetical protein n=1 Tax=Variovorax sp. J31P179 TaxID=3053508 RepID=UPI002574E541|nr:hypothetical protein [Variovorax sp. J31P179]MDM0084805.1 hypothetical protein [Variovorax sp. J31P179]